MAVNLVSQLNSFRGDRFVGKTVGEIRDNDTIVDLFDLNGSEHVVFSTNGVDFMTANDSTVVVDGMTVRFDRPVGTKG